MDNFGIFKLLNSFYDFMTKTKTSSSDESTQKDAPEKAQKDMQSPKKESENLSSVNAAAPLQSAMLNTLNNHDAFVKRVLKNKKEP
ncbi:MAG: hypothetical protein J6Y43_03185 [Clostridia bacterium]|nr:hypothetical protein [Clostridia bacterium]